ncbi:dipeptide/oligopeptide/nickel ABC transporter permease/ATP-binding protein [Nonomuraea terrae]|uniref:Dipeptide/oligopeptide/nickel ABC transporter permease/ATP-binding protein n=1 Tax=Nonomuraea terrae TaxID=2530383 RepID=A0A4R4YCW5_9ACTN|nr:dipeptide/oligopeptide/nickel ABC transporter permease/ATP-binding protein [Nonomuraea terrae]TDD42491.1 dipeptide/oligopeptide/nickel ABC transporter permease/ATP-binding protein [Nonomuraea terrae]
MRGLKNPLGIAALVSLVFLLFMVVLGPILWGEEAVRTDTMALTQGVSAAHPMGTDGLGRDVLARVMAASRSSVGLALLATAVAVAGGLLLGALPAVLGRRAAGLLNGFVSLVVAFPGLLIALVLAVVLGSGGRSAAFAIGLASVPAFARLTQTLAASVAGRDFVAAARVLGVGRARMLFRHILPNIGEPLIVQATLGAGGALLAFAALSFLGLGVQAPDYDWGLLLNEGLNRVYVNPAAALAPGIAVVLAGLAFNILGEYAAQVFGGRDTIARAEGRSARPVPGDALIVRDLRVSFGPAVPVKGVSFTVAPGERVGLVGESGSGKSLTALAVAGLVEPPGVVTGTIEAGETAMVFQDPMTSLNPALRVGTQIAEVATTHQRLSRRDAARRAVARLADVHIGAPARVAGQYPHELSGGMRQRAMIAMGLMGAPRLIVADEPTTALDVTVQKQILDLLREASTTSGAAVLLISHDLAVVAQLCSRVLVMYAGVIVEDLTTERLVAGPAHPYTRALLASVPDMSADRSLPLATIHGRMPSPAEPVTGCPFAPRCPRADERCLTAMPPFTSASGGGGVACWHPVRETGGGPVTRPDEEAPDEEDPMRRTR